MMMKLHTELKLMKDTGGDVLPSLGGYSVMLGDVECQFDFEDSEGNLGGTVLNITQSELDIDSYRDIWFAEGIIEADMSDEEIEKRVFETIRDAEEIDEIFIEMWDCKNSRDYDSLTTIVKMKLEYGEETVNLLTKKIGNVFDGPHKDNFKIAVQPLEPVNPVEFFDK